MTQDTSTKAWEALMNYQQADMDGIMVLASRQAIHECKDDLDALAAERDTLSKRSEDIAEKYSQLADKYAKAVDEVIELKKQLAPRQSVQEAARVLLDVWEREGLEAMGARLRNLAQKGQNDE
ncbi:hypothetical protein [Tritonibacter scottomollicae]|uniref:hypothetical protein n=1 Tax=Tritonibacter scottomollicae TaxID=483013 RepID=UPI003AA8AFF0